MTVVEFINELMKYPPDKEVMLPLAGYEEGLGITMDYGNLTSIAGIELNKAGNALVILD